MRIVIETDEAERPKPLVQPQPSAEVETARAAPPEIAASAAALGAASAGPAPAEAAAEPPPFVAEPVTPETAPEGAEGMSAGAAPQFALGPVDEVAVESGAEEGGEAEG